MINEVYQDFESMSLKMEKIVKAGELDRTILKVVEESMELNEVLVKTITKRQDLKPPVEKIIEEMGDLSFRMNVLALKLGIMREVKQREREKFEQVSQWVAENKK